MDLFSGAFDERNFVQQTREKPSERLPQIDVKPLDIVEPQILGKSSVLGKTSSNPSATKDVGKNDFQPKVMTKNHSEKALIDDKKQIIEAQRISEGTNKKEKSKPIIDSNLDIKYKTIFKSNKIPISMFFENPRKLNMPSLNPLNQSFEHSSQSKQQSEKKSPEKLDSNNKLEESIGEPKLQNNIVNNSKSNQLPVKKQSSVSTRSQNSVDTNQSAGLQDSNFNNDLNQPGISNSSSSKLESIDLAPPAPIATPKLKKPVTTIQSIFEKYRKLNKTVTKIVHKKEKGKTQKWVYFADGTSVLEPDEEHPSPPSKEVKKAVPKPTNTNQYPNYNDYNLNGSGMNPNYQQIGVKSSIKPSNVYFYDHANLVAEFDPNNPNNIALTVYEIETLQQKHKFCKYFDPTPSEKYNELAAVVDHSSRCFSSMYHNLDLLDDEELLKPIKKEEKIGNKFWKKTLRKSNKRMISKKNATMISKNKNN